MKRWRRIGLGVWVGLVCTVGVAGAAWSPAELERFEQGNALYQAGDFAGARDAYRALVDAGAESADIYYNLGNASYQASDIGHAIWAYLRAARLAPTDEDIAANLAFARARIRDAAPGRGEESWFLNQLAAITRLVPARLALVLAACVYVIVTGLILMRWRTRRVPGPSWILSGIVLWIALGAYALLRLGAEREQERVGVIVVDEVEALNEPVMDGRMVFVLHAGTELTLGRDLGGWVEVTLGADLKGWLPADALREV